MAVAAFTTWERLGRPLDPCQGVRDLVEKARVQWPKVKNFSWYANDEHYESDYPQDHTPFSMTGWPAVSPQWFVFATDFMHQPTLGFDVFKLWPYWLAEARAGRIKNLKYLIHKAKIYDVRNGWREQASSGHESHVHFSFTTNALNVGLGDWSPNPGGSMTSPVPAFLADGKDSASKSQLNNVHGWSMETVVLTRELVRKLETLETRLAIIEGKLSSGATVPGLTEAKIREVLRDELNKTKLTS